MVKHVSRVYAEACRSQPEEYYEYDQLVLEYGSVDNYWVTRKLGRGKYSEVFEGVNCCNDEQCVIKVLKPIKKRKIKKEIAVLVNLTGAPGIVRLLDLVRSRKAKIPCMVFEFINSTSWHEVVRGLTDEDLKIYMHQIIKTLDFAHSVGIMHRDIKPDNIMIDTNTKTVKVIDWGLAEFYLPGTEYNVSVATRPFKGPELLVGYRLYDYSLDLWMVGCLMGALIFNKDPYLFYGGSNQDQLVRIVKVLGTDGLDRYLDKYDIELDPVFDDLIAEKEPVIPWEELVDPKKKHLATDDAIDLVDKLLKYDHQARLTCKEALDHEYFADLEDF